MTEEEKKHLTADTDGLLTYEFIANHIGTEDLDIHWLVENMERVDAQGQFTASAARYLNAIDAELYKGEISDLIASTIEKDREHRYLPTLLTSIYGDDYEQHAAELSLSDNNFRRIYKRLHPTSAL
ncbi:MAG: hypothetical protein HDS64_03710 [Bacteroidales bacterium]|nr:hypothetical protein [Bacteroidales bacterium]MBD5281806.1 hypothetical protein [Bacteroides sp.]MDE6032461.1 hypothetical protein [Muribaculaceae bacterium]MBD5293449.1 hypothetical protein [Bacteroides sp.]MBD5359241.1 hypothetical protein [Bacteroides sp.]